MSPITRLLHTSHFLSFPLSLLVLPPPCPVSGLLWGSCCHLGSRSRWVMLHLSGASTNSVVTRKLFMSLTGIWRPRGDEHRTLIWVFCTTGWKQRAGMVQKARWCVIVGPAMWIRAGQSIKKTENRYMTYFNFHIGWWIRLFYQSSGHWKCSQTCCSCAEPTFLPIN